MQRTRTVPGNMKLILVQFLTLTLGVELISSAVDPLNDDLFIAVDENNDDFLPEITADHVHAAMALAQQKMRYVNIHDHSLYSLGIYLDKNSAGFGRFDAPQNSDEINHAVYTSMIITSGLGYLADGHCNSYNLTRNEYIQLLLKKKFRLLGICKVSNEPDLNVLKKPEINKYRTIDGSYNNLRNPTHGKTNTIFPRILYPDYGDGVASPRRAKSGKKLRSARTVSTKIFTSLNKQDVSLSNAGMEITQIVSHDMSLQNMDNNLATGPVSCCRYDQKCLLPKIYQHKSCQAIPVEKEEDAFYKNFGIGCLNFVRSSSAPRPDCYLGVRQQMNTVTGYLDLSIVYGSDETTQTALRTFKSGMLVETKSRHMPACSTNNDSFCYNAGDVRVNQQIYLASVQTILMREHNRIAKNLLLVNPTWDDERLYQESRRILIAIHQNIVYSDLLPILLGNNILNYTLGKVDSNGYSYCYNTSLNGATHNDFTIAYRVLHSLIPSEIKLCDAAWKMLKSFKFSDMMGNMTILESYADGLDNSLRGMAATLSERSDPFVTSEVTNLMFKGNNAYGIDLMAMDIERGRDHGVPGYNIYREYCGLKRAKTFEDLSNTIPKEVITILKALYTDPDDIDLVVGGLVEVPKTGSKFGPVIDCILREQFHRTACGDRFFYSNIKQTYPFTPAQLNEIKKVTMTTLFCQNGDNLKNMTRNALLIQSATNPIVNCSSVPTMNFNVFKMK